MYSEGIIIVSTFWDHRLLNYHEDLLETDTLVYTYLPFLDKRVFLY